MALTEEAASTEHFYGAFVCAQGNNVPGSIPQYWVIDGQQRLVTVAVLLCALRDVATEKELEPLVGKIQDNYLTMKHERGLDR